MTDNVTKVVITADDRTAGAFTSLRASISDAGKIIAGMSAAWVAGAAVMAKQSIDAADRIGKMSQSTGIAVDKLSALSYAAKLSDVDTAALGSAMVKLTKGMSDAAMGTGEAIRGYKALGISVKDSSGNLKSSDSIMGEVANKFAGMQDGANKTALAVALFGKSGAEMIPLLNSGAEGLAASSEEAKKLGLVLDGETTAAAERFNDNLTRLNAVKEGFSNQIMKAMLPSLDGLSAQLFDSASNMGGMETASRAAATGMKLVMSAGALIFDVFKSLGDVLGGVGAALVALFSGEFKQAFDIAKMTMKDFTANGAATAGIIGAIWDDAAAKAVAKAPATGEKLAAPMMETVKVIKEQKQKITDVMGKLWQEQLDAMQKSTAAITAETQQLLDQTTELRYGKDALEQIKRARDAATIATLQATLAGIDETNQCSLEAEAIREKIAALESYTAAVADNTDAVRQNAADAAALGQQADVWRSIETTAHDTFVSIFDSGKDAFTRLRDVLKNTLYDFLYQMTLKKWIINISAGVSGTAASTAAFGADGGFGLGNLFSGASMFGSLASGASAAMSMGIVNGFSAGMTSIAGAGMSSYAAGLMLPGIGLAVGALGLLGAFGSRGTPTASTGNLSRTYGAGGELLRTDYNHYSVGNQGADVLDSLAASLHGLQTALGVTGGATFNYGGNTGRNGQSPNFALGGGTFYQGETAYSDAALQLAASRAVLSALQQSDMPDYLRRVFDGLTPASMNVEQIAAATDFGIALRNIYTNLTETRDPATILADNIASLGVELGTSATTVEQFKTSMIAAIEAGTVTPQNLASWQTLEQLIGQTAVAAGEVVAATIDLTGQRQREIEIMRLTGDEAGALAATRADELAGLDSVNAALQARIYALTAAQSAYDSAKSDLLAAYNRESAAAQQLADKMRGFADGFARLRTSLNLGSLSTLSPEQKYLESQRQFDDISRRAQLGDAAAMGQLEGVSQQFLQASQDYNASSEAYASDFARVNAALLAGGDVASRQADIATQQVDLLRTQLTALGLINASVLSVGDAISAFVSARGALDGAQGVSGSSVPVTSRANNQGLSISASDSAMVAAAKVLYQSATGGVDTALYNQYVGAVGGAVAGWNGDPASLRRLYGFADGGTASRGYYLAHENELIYSDAATRIYPAEQTSAILNRLNSPASNEETVAELKAQTVELRALIRQNGAGMQMLLDKLTAMEQRLAETERTARLTRAAA